MPLLLPFFARADFCGVPEENFSSQRQVKFCRQDAAFGASPKNRASRAIRASTDRVIVIGLPSSFQDSRKSNELGHPITALAEKLMPQWVCYINSIIRSVHSIRRNVAK